MQTEQIFNAVGDSIADTPESWHAQQDLISSIFESIQNIAELSEVRVFDEPALCKLQHVDSVLDYITQNMQNDASANVTTIRFEV